MNAIWKYPISRGITNMNVPEGAKPLSVHLQDGRPVVYFQVNVHNQPELRQVRLFETGEQFTSSAAIYLGTVGFKDFQYVLHCYVQ